MIHAQGKGAGTLPRVSAAFRSLPEKRYNTHMQAAKEQTGEVFPLAAFLRLAENRVWGPISEDQPFIGGRSWLRSTTHWGSPYPCGTTASDSTYGRFNTPDRYQSNAPQKESATWNRYSYAQGDPVNFSDPRGTYECHDCSEDGSLTCDVEYHWDPFTGFCAPNNPGSPPKTGEDTHPTIPTCAVVLFAQSAVFDGSPYLHTYVQVLAANKDTLIFQDYEAGPSNRYDGYLNRLPDELNGKNSYSPSSQLQFSTGFSRSTCSTTETLQSVFDKYQDNKYLYYNPYNSNSFTFSLLLLSGVSIPSTVSSYLSDRIIPLGLKRAPGWGLLIPGWNR
jgi:RHS repeat-associated protein